MSAGEAEISGHKGLEERCMTRALPSPGEHGGDGGGARRCRRSSATRPRGEERVGADVEEEGEEPAFIGVVAIGSGKEEGADAHKSHRGRSVESLDERRKPRAKKTQEGLRGLPRVGRNLTRDATLR